MKLTFLGSGGGRFSAISQRRMTGGFRIDNLSGKNYHIDPGPGALVRTYQFGLDPRNINGVFVSHAHTDHYNDAEILIEAMTKGMTKRNGTIIGSPRLGPPRLLAAVHRHRLPAGGPRRPPARGDGRRRGRHRPLTGFPPGDDRVPRRAGASPPRARSSAHVTRVPGERAHQRDDERAPRHAIM